MGVLIAIAAAVALAFAALACCAVGSIDDFEDPYIYRR